MFGAPENNSVLTVLSWILIDEYIHKIVALINSKIIIPFSRTPIIILYKAILSVVMLR
jgi:hypothetical protein